LEAIGVRADGDHVGQVEAGECGGGGDGLHLAEGEFWVGEGGEIVKVITAVAELAGVAGEGIV
jgi:hypothetical protein